MPTPTFRSLASVPYGIRTNTTVAAPDGVVDGDVLILVHLTGNPDGAPSATMPAGFTMLSGFPSSVTDSGGFQVTTRIAYKIANGEGSSYPITHDNGRSEALLIAVSAGASGVPQVTVNNGNGDTSTALSLTTTDDSALVAFIAHNWGLYGSGQVPPSGSAPTFTERFNTSTGLIYLATGTLASAGATGDKTQLNGNSAPATDRWSAFLLAIEPGGAFHARAYYDMIGMTTC